MYKKKACVLQVESIAAIDLCASHLAVHVSVLSVNLPVYNLYITCFGVILHWVTSPLILPTFPHPPNC